MNPLTDFSFFRAFSLDLNAPWTLNFLSFLAMMFLQFFAIMIQFDPVQSFLDRFYIWSRHAHKDPDPKVEEKRSNRNYISHEMCHRGTLLGKGSKTVNLDYLFDPGEKSYPIHPDRKTHTWPGGARQFLELWTTNREMSCLTPCKVEYAHNEKYDPYP